jgi:hypothetical protein
VLDPKRASKVMTATDAFGRKRVARGPRRRRAAAVTEGEAREAKTA